NLRDELGELVEAIAFKAQEKGLELILDTTSLTRSNIITDPGRLRQILTNLIGNAVKFTHSGEICLTVMLDELDDHSGRLRIDVRDSGIGIPADKIDKLFQTFAQADNSTTRKYGGTGLGLAIVKQLCELMDGSVWITSVEHKGSTFHVDIGVGLGEAFALSIPSISVAGKSALVVDDNETNRAVVRAQLEQWGMDVYESVDPINAFDDLQIRISQGYIPPYDVAILDMQMPNMDGAALGAEIRKLRECDAMKMVMMTSLGSRNDAAQFAERGFDAFFAKPATAKDLLNALKVLFDAETELGSTHSFVTKDYLGTLLEETTGVQWPVNTRLLLVDDNPTNQIVAQGMLEMIGLEADVAYNGLEALEAMQMALDIAPYTVVLMDCQMPEMDGYAASIAIREGKAGEANKTVPIIAMTANAMSGDREKCLISGMSDYISKPINLAVLKTTLIKWLKGEAVTVSAMPMSDEALKSQTQEPHELQVWDEADALKRLGGKKELLFKIMESFLSESPRLMSALKTAIEEGNLANMQLHSHSIKGAAGNVSAQQLQILAKTLEEAAKNGQEDILKEEYGSLEQAMQEVCTVFQKELSKETKPAVKKKSYDPLAMAVTLQKLKKEIEAGAYIDTDSFDIFNEYSDELFMGRMNTLKEYIDRFATSEALELLNTIMNELR
ncbi:MAG TPA: response regulator, partial [Sulfuricurvum sp.]|nr:response regulator [Sulfuricurvum sp.]